MVGARGWERGSEGLMRTDFEFGKKVLEMDGSVGCTMNVLNAGEFCT